MGRGHARPVGAQLEVRRAESGVRLLGRVSKVLGRGSEPLQAPSTPFIGIWGSAVSSPWGPGRNPGAN